MSVVTKTVNTCPEVDAVLACVTQVITGVKGKQSVATIVESELPAVISALTTAAAVPGDFVQSRSAAINSVLLWANGLLDVLVPAAT